MLKTHQLANLLIFLLLFPLTLHAQWFADSGVEFIHTDNLSRSAVNGASDTGMSLSAAGGYHRQLADFTGLTLSGNVSKNIWQEYSGMNSLSLGASASISHKFGIGADVPVLNLDLALQHEGFNWEQRDNTAFTAGINISKRVTERLLLTLGAAYEDVNGSKHLAVPPPGFNWGSKPGDVWNFDAWQISSSAELELGPASWLSGSFSYRDGDIVSTGIIYTTNNDIIACTWDQVFGAKAVAYRLPGRTRRYVLDYNHAIFRSSTFYAGVEYINAFAENGVDYNSTIFRSGFLYSY